MPTKPATVNIAAVKSDLIQPLAATNLKPPPLITKTGLLHVQILLLLDK